MTVTEFRKAWAGLPSNGWLDLEEALLLVEAAEMTSGPMVEIGTYYGRSAVLLAQLKDEGPDEFGCSKLPRTLYCVDPWEDCGEFKFGPNVTGDEVFEAFLNNIKGLPIIYVRTRVEDWVPPPVLFEFWYLDGDHTYQGTRRQINTALANGARVIAVHDVNDDGGGVVVKRACLELLGPWKERVGHLAVWELK